MNPSVIELWQQFKRDNKVTHNRYETWSFGNSPAMADELLSLVLIGAKTGTSSLQSLYTLENEKMPEVGEYSVILDGENQAKVIIRSKVIDVIPYNQVSEVHGYLEGEGDRTLTYWRSVHQPFFEAELAEYGREFKEDLLVVYELFEVVYRA